MLRCFMPTGATCYRASFHHCVDVDRDEELIFSRNKYSWVAMRIIRPAACELSCRGFVFNLDNVTEPVFVK